MKTCPEITMKQFAETSHWGQTKIMVLKQCVYSKIQGKTWNSSKNFNTILCVQMHV